MDDIRLVMEPWPKQCLENRLYAESISEMIYSELFSRRKIMKKSIFILFLVFFFSALRVFAQNNPTPSEMPQDLFERYNRSVVSQYIDGELIRHVLMHQRFTCFSPLENQYCVEKFTYETTGSIVWPEELNQFENIYQYVNPMKELEYEWISDIDSFCLRKKGNLEMLETKVGILRTCKLDYSSGKVLEQEWYAAGIVFPLVKSLMRSGNIRSEYHIEELNSPLGVSFKQSREH